MNITQQLTSFATKLDNKGFIVLANELDSATSNLIAVSKEIGSQGYWVRNERCWQGCYRNKRASSPRTPAQKVWMQCLDEYQDAVKGKNADWDKYASSDSTIKIGSTQYDQNLLSYIASSEGSEVAELVFEHVSKQLQKHKTAYFTAVESLLKIAHTVENADLSKEASDLAEQIYTEAAIGDTLKGLWNAGKGVGQGVANKVREFNANGAGSRIGNELDKAYQAIAKSFTDWKSALNKARTEINGFLTSKNPKVVQRAQQAEQLLQNIHSISLPQSQGLPQIKQTVEQLKNIMSGVDANTTPATPANTAPPGSPASPATSTAPSATPAASPANAPANNAAPATPQTPNFIGIKEIDDALKNVTPDIQMKLMDLLRQTAKAANVKRFNLLTAQVAGATPAPTSARERLLRDIQNRNQGLPLTQDQAAQSVVSEQVGAPAATVPVATPRKRKPKAPVPVPGVAPTVPPAAASQTPAPVAAPASPVTSANDPYDLKPAPTPTTTAPTAAPANQSVDSQGYDLKPIEFTNPNPQNFASDFAKNFKLLPQHLRNQLMPQIKALLGVGVQPTPNSNVAAQPQQTAPSTPADPYMSQTMARTVKTVFKLA